MCTLNVCLFRGLQKLNQERLQAFNWVDGCHLKEAYPCMILVVVSKDANNVIFAMAWAVVEAQNTSSWMWCFRVAGEGY